MSWRSGSSWLVGICLGLPLLAGCDTVLPQRGAPVSSSQPAVSADRCPPTFTVQAGDTVYSVARLCGVSVRQLIETNSLQPPYALPPGSTLRMPGALAEIIVAKGDTLSGIARAHHVDLQSLAQANNKTPPYVIRVGEHLRLPGAYGGAAVASAPIVIKSDASVPSAAPPATVPPPAAAAPRGAVVPVAPLPPLALPPPPKPAQNTPDSPAVTEARPPEQVAAVAPIPAPPPPAATVPALSKGFLWPLRGDLLIGFGPQAAKGQNNDGLNIAAAKGTRIHATEGGTVAYVGNELKGFGNLVLIKHADGWMSAYAHADQLLVKKGDSVRKGQEIGTVGQTGSVTQPQLHFELRRQGEAVDPLQYLPE